MSKIRNPVLMRYCLNSILLLILTLNGYGQIIDRNEFEPRIGSVFQYEGSFQGHYGDAVVTYLDGSAVVPNSLRADTTFSSTDPEGNFSMTTYSVSASIQRRVIHNQYGNFTQYYSPGWRLGPRFIEIGRYYQSSSDFYYTVSGTKVDGTVRSSGRITGIETVTVPVGTFQALKAVIDTVIDESFPGGWSQTIERDTFWIVRGVGTVKFQAVAEYTDFRGADRQIDTDYELIYANGQLPELTVLQSDSWYEGFCLLYYPWIYFFGSRRWVYLEDNPMHLDVSESHYSAMDQGFMDGYVYLYFPWAYCYSDNHFHYIYDPTTMFDLMKGSAWLLD